MNAVAVGEHEESSRPSRPKAAREDRIGRENAGVENRETQSGTHVPKIVEQLARMDPADLARLLAAVSERAR